MKVLVTGGTGYIGSHTVVELINNGCDVVIVDNLSNSKLEVLNRIELITNTRPLFYKCDLLNYEGLSSIFKEHKLDAVIHFAGLKAVGESGKYPLNYYHNNITGTLILLKIMQENNVKNIVFSSSATVYGIPKTVPIKEDFPLSATNPYGKTKLFIEEILRDYYASDNSNNIAILRYFNPIGAHKSGLIGEDPTGIPNNLSPYITQVIVGKLDKVTVFGNDYDTPDGTGVRDYIHVLDLARGHMLALNKLMSNSGLVTYNLGTGKGYSVLEMIKAYEMVTNKTIPYTIAARRLGDIAENYADPHLASVELGFIAEYSLDQMCKDSHNWQIKNPNGYIE